MLRRLRAGATLVSSTVDRRRDTEQNGRSRPPHQGQVLLHRLHARHHDVMLLLPDTTLLALITLHSRPFTEARCSFTACNARRISCSQCPTQR